MNTIKLNNSEFELTSFSRNTYFSDNEINSTANCDLRIIGSSILDELADADITSLQIKHDNDVIYNLTDISAKITNISEYLNTDYINTSVSLTFDME